MPIYMRNELIVSGDPDQMEDLLLRSKGKINFEEFFPIPEGMDEQEALLYKLNWWGTKRIIVDKVSPEEMEQLKYNVSYDQNGQIKTMQIIFDTVITPPLLFFHNLQKIYPKLRFYLYYDDYFDVYGKAVTKLEDGIPYFDMSDYGNRNGFMI